MRSEDAVADCAAGRIDVATSASAQTVRCANQARTNRLATS
jgi:hypothetical protein